MEITLGFSSCPNDTFMFDALVNSKIDTGGIKFNVHIADVEELNKLALNNKLEVTKLSYFAYTKVFKQYQWLTSGSALGRNNGPMLISKRKIYKSWRCKKCYRPFKKKSREYARKKKREVEE